MPESDLVELRARLARTRWPEPSPAPGRTQGVPLDAVRDLCRYWADGYDWRIAEDRLNAVSHYLVRMTGCGSMWCTLGPPERMVPTGRSQISAASAYESPAIWLRHRDAATGRY